MKTARKIRWLMAALGIAVLAGCGSAGGSASDYDMTESAGEGTGIISTAGSPAEMEIGDIIAYDLNGGSVTVDFSGVGTNSKFILVTGTYDTVSGSSIEVNSDTVDLGDELEKTVGVPKFETVGEEEGSYDARSILSSWLRAAERDLSITGPKFADKSVPPAGLSKQVGVGYVQSFRVLKNITVIDSYVTIEAFASCLRSNIVIYVDTRVRSLPPDFDGVCDLIDRLAGRVKDIFGDISDVNGDGLLTILMTPQVNRLGGSGGGVIAGYFFGSDLYERSDGNPVSNQQEIIYIMAPDPEGEHGPRISNEYFFDKLLPGVVPHELQHAVNFNQHVFVNGGLSEESWLAEGLSHLAEDLVGYGNENPSRYRRYLASPSSTALIDTGSPTLSERGAAFLFLRYLYEQAGDGASFLRRLENSGRTGVDNLVAAFGGTDSNFDEFSEFVAHWSVALAMSDRGISDNAKFNYRVREIDEQSGNWKGVILSGEVGDSYDTKLDGVRLVELASHHDQILESSSAGYYGIDSAPGWASVEAGGASDYAVLIRTE